MGCRFATKEDRTHFIDLWSAYLLEQREGGASLLPNDRNLLTFRNYFDAYATGQLPGVTVFWEEAGLPVGVVLAGGDFSESIWDTDYARLATVWGVYVRPEYRGKRIGLQMEQFGEPVLVQHGFTAAKSSVRVSNPLGSANQRHWDGHRGIEDAQVLFVAKLGSDAEEE